MRQEGSGQNRVSAEAHAGAEPALGSASEFRAATPYSYQHWMTIGQSLPVNHRTLLFAHTFLRKNPEL